MKLIYKPFGLVLGILAGLLSKRIFDFIWSRFDDEKAPEATTRDVSTAKAVSAAALQGLVFKGTRAAVDRYGARSFYRMTGTWPGPKAQEPVE